MPKKTPGSPATTPADETLLRLPPTYGSPGQARAAVREQLTAWRAPAETIETAELLISELVTNAVCHAGNPPGRDIRMRFALKDALLRLKVSDACTDRPRQRTAGPAAETGRGLFLITALADDWGVEARPHGIGKTVWVELKCASAAATSTAQASATPTIPGADPCS
ncbi:ATP-binding protein [Streptomyces sp. H27-D2]|uniref:ATP-binding protein n=1 Tax=Streptomyces sp. H27-D2 TaxID=3046304 RepID=UPI002DBD88DE|nr:ATP-binding protein [Streptomyces sp. H27-D2]MEC4017128.1 ATP-binding protein [Streptomyces sp. H27-D2]